jgi:GNAT superfamily N-acetyltransferase
LSPPTRLTTAHVLESFACGVPVLDEWLKRRAALNNESGASRSYVVCQGTVVVGYYCLATGGVTRVTAPGSIRRNMPDPIPVIVLGRLAVDQRFQGQGVGRALLRDAILRVLQVADSVGVRAILVHAISDEAKRFYQTNGFLASPIEPMTLCLPLETARAALAAPASP